VRSIYRDTITVYNRRAGAIARPPFPPTAARWERTVIKGTRFRNSTQVNATSEGASFIAQTVSVTIPESADTGGKKYVQPSDYARLPQDDQKHWTVRSDRANPDFIVFGEAPEITEAYTIEDLQREYGDRRVMRPQAVRGSMEMGILQLKVTGV
jgi:hypothetical protein